jgi:hypothetical protein
MVHHLKSAKIYFCFAVLLLVAKPFLGFSVFSPVNNPPSADNILVKAFTKRKQEYVEHSSYDIHAIQKKLADPVTQYILRFSFLLSVLFPVVFAAGSAITNRFLRGIILSLSPPGQTYLLNSTLLI